MLTKFIADALRGTKFEHSIRCFYYGCFGPFIRKSLTIESLEASFRVPTPDAADELTACGGEREILKRFLERLPPNVVVWDIGANMGMWALLCSAKLGGTGSVIAFEPDPRARLFLKKNIRLNKADNISVLSCAVGSESGNACFFVGTRDSQVSGLAPQNGEYPTEDKGVKVQIMRGEDIVVQELAQAPFAVKIDVEGAELAVLRGFGDKVWSALRLIAVEVHPLLIAKHGGSVEEIEALLRERGFKTIFSSARRTELHWLCSKP